MTNNIINKGFFDSFSVFRMSNIDNYKDYEKTLKKLIKTNLIISSERLSKQEIHLNSQFNEFKNKRFEMYVNAKNEQKIQPAEIRGDFVNTGDNPKVYIDQTGERIKLENNIIDNLVASQEFELNRIAALYNFEKKYTGFPSHDFKNIFLLYPCKAYLDEEIVYISFFLTIYKNGLAILNSKVKINNRNLNRLSTEMYDLDFDKVLLPQFLFSDSEKNNYKKKAKCNSLNEIEDIYKKYLKTFFNIKYFSVPFNFLTLIDFKYRPRKFQDDFHAFNHSIYDLLCAPTTEFNSKDNVSVKNFIKKKYFETSNFHRYYGNNNRIISVYTERIEEKFKQITIKNDNRKLKDWEVYYLSLTGVINVIEAVLFKKFINDNYLLSNLNDKTSMRELLKLKIKVKKDSILDLKRHFYDYGSLGELQEFMNNNCDDYTKSTIAAQWSTEIEELIKLKREKLVSTFSILGLIVTIILTLVFSFPAIKQISTEIGLEQRSMIIYTVFNISFALMLFLVFIKQVLTLFNSTKEFLNNLCRKMFNFIKKIYFKFH